MGRGKSAIRAQTAIEGEAAEGRKHLELIVDVHTGHIVQIDGTSSVFARPVLLRKGKQTNGQFADSCIHRPYGWRS